MTKTYTFDLDIISDLHKDAYGFRPSESFWRFLAAANADQKQAVWDELLVVLERETERYYAEQARAIADFEQRMAGLMHLGAPDFETVIRWLHDAEDTNGDDDYLEFKLNLPYGYIARSRSFQQIARLEQADCA